MKGPLSILRLCTLMKSRATAMELAGSAYRPEVSFI